MTNLERLEVAYAAATPAYDAGLLNDYGGGNVEWWWDYIRAELNRADQYYQTALAHNELPGLIAEMRRLREALIAVEHHEIKGNPPEYENAVGRMRVLARAALGDSDDR